MSKGLHMESQVSHRDWHLMHALAGWTVASIVLGIGLSTAYPDQVVTTAASIGQLSAPWLIARVFIGLGAIAGIWLWLRMASDYLRQQPPQHSLAWGITVFVGQVVGGLLYFWWMWRPRKASNLRAQAA
jgi:hypothetical protein